MTGPQPIDRSLAFTALLEFEWFRKTEVRAGEKVVTAFLTDYYASSSENIWRYGQEWGHPVTGLAFQPGGWFTPAGGLPPASAPAEQP